jgi:hypothetical protein
VSQPAVPHPNASYPVGSGGASGVASDRTTGMLVDPQTGLPMASGHSRVVLHAMGGVGGQGGAGNAGYFAVDKEALGYLSKAWAEAAAELEAMLNDYKGLGKVRPPADDPVSVTTAQAFRILGERANGQLSSTLNECLKVGTPLGQASAQYGQADEKALLQLAEATQWVNLAGSSLASGITVVTFTESRPTAGFVPWETTALVPPTEDAVFNHQKIWEELHSGDSGQDMGEAQAAWASGLAHRLERVQQQLSEATVRGSAEWLGATADAFRGAAHPFTQFLWDTQNVCKTIGDVMTEQLALFNRTRHDMPEPVQIDLVKDLTMTAIASFFAGVPLHMEKEDQAVQASTRAQEVYQVYRTESAELIKRVPDFPAPPSASSTPSGTSTGSSDGTRRTAVSPPAASVSTASSSVPSATPTQQQMSVPRPQTTADVISGSDGSTPTATTQQAASLMPVTPEPGVPGSGPTAFGPTVTGSDLPFGALGGGARVQPWAKAPNVGSPAEESRPGRLGRGASAGIAEPAEERMPSTASGRGGVSQARPEQAPQSSGRPDGEEDREHRRRYVADEDRHWGDDEQVTVPVIGDDDPEDYIDQGLGHEMGDVDGPTGTEQTDVGLLEVAHASPASPVAPAIRELDNYLWGNDVG